MAMELQGLLNRIQDEGVQKADEKANEIMSKAKEEAVNIINKAKEDAEQSAKFAEEEANKSEARAKATIQQASRDVILSLRNELEDRLKKVIADSVSDAMTTEKMGEILIEMAKKNNNDAGIEVILAKKDMDDMEKLFKGSLVKDLKNNPELTLGFDFKSGLKIGFKGDDIFFDFSDDALSDIICSFVGPKLTAIIK